MYFKLTKKGVNKMIFPIIIKSVKTNFIQYDFVTKTQYKTNNRNISFHSIPVARIMTKDRPFSYYRMITH